MSVRTADNRYLVEAQPALVPDRPTDRSPDRSPDRSRHADHADAAAIAMTAAIAAGFERIITAYPEQWYPFHPVWEATPALATAADEAEPVADVTAPVADGATTAGR
jgi:lauroyl/myristoyl acyltransferase